jgi:glycosyltransferase involved in cell wall biosynthesis
VPARICLVTTLQPAANPRLVKEADALVEAGHTVRVVAAHWADWATSFEDELVATRRWRCDTLDWRRDVNPALFWKSRIRHFAARRLARIPMLAPLVEEAAASRIGPDLLKPAESSPADLFIAHNLGALPAALAAAARFRAAAGFDAEDFHSGQLSRHEDRHAAAVVRSMERRLLRGCQYVTAASPAIAAAYRELCGIPLPTSILNVFPLADRPACFRCADATAPLTLYWFSQTIGPDRGLEDAVRALGLLPPGSVELHLRGRWAGGYEKQLRRLAADVGLDERRIIAHEPAPAAEMVRLAAHYDVGLALEPPVTVNSDILLSNKIFTFLLAGNAVIATRTKSQSWLASHLGHAIALCDSGQPQSLATALQAWLDSRERLDAARSDAWSLGSMRFNWNHEKTKFLDVVNGTLDRAGRPGAFHGTSGAGEPLPVHAA